jgi:uncharacterized coiled-coil protein SlyX
MGADERVGDLRARALQETLNELTHRVEVQKRYINQQGRALEMLGEICSKMQADARKLADRFDDLQAELTYQLLPWYTRLYIWGCYQWQELRLRFREPVTATPAHDADAAAFVQGLGLVEMPADTKNPIPFKQSESTH